MKKVPTVITVILLMLMVFTFSSSLEAEVPSGGKKAESTAGPATKAERGLKNAALGWTEIPKRIIDKTKESNPISGLLVGAWQGTCKAFARTASGVSDLATFPIGRYDKPAVLPDMPAAE